MAVSWNKFMESSHYFRIYVFKLSVPFLITIHAMTLSRPFIRMVPSWNLIIQLGMQDSYDSELAASFSNRTNLPNR